MRSRTLAVALLMFALLLPAAGASYMEGREIPDDGQMYLLAAATGLGSDPVQDPGGPIKRYLSDDPNDYVLVPGDDPDMMYALGDMPAYADKPVAISAPPDISTSVPSYVSKPPSVPSIRSMATASNTGAETVMPPDYFAPANSSKLNPSVNGLLHLDAASQGYDVSKIGSIAMHPMPSRAGVAIPMFAFPDLFR